MFWEHMQHSEKYELCDNLPEQWNAEMGCRRMKASGPCVDLEEISVTQTLCSIRIS